MDITPAQIKALRDETGISVMQCKAALEEAGGDMEQARVILRKKGAAAAAKKMDRELGAGTVGSYVHAGGDVASLVLLSCETDFVAKNEEFAALARDIAMHVTALAPRFRSREDVDAGALDAARAVFMKEVEDKPEELREKIVAGKLDAYLKEQVLLEQSFIKDPERTIADLVEAATQKFGERVVVAAMSRLSVH